MDPGLMAIAQALIASGQKPTQPQSPFGMNPNMDSNNFDPRAVQGNRTLQREMPWQMPFPSN